MSAAITVPQVRRALSFENSDQIIQEAERLAAGPHRLLGKWSYGQILEHLATGIDGFYSGFGFQAPWFARAFIAPFIKRQILAKGMSAGFQLPKSADRLLPSPEITVADGLQHLRHALDRHRRESPTHPHPFFGKMTPDEVRRLILRHAELHLSFVAPE